VAAAGARLVLVGRAGRPVWGRGSGIFLHRQTGGPTAGCVSLREADLLAVLRWLRPGTRIVMGPAAYVRRL